MKNVGVVVAVALTALVVMVIAVLNFSPQVGAASGDMALPPTAAPAPIIGDPAAIQAAFVAREALIQAQIQVLDHELAARSADYDARVVELTGLIATGEANLAQLSAGEIALREQVDELSAALADRGLLYEGQRAQAYQQYQASLQQLQIQLDEANAKLADARAQLGQ